MGGRFTLSDDSHGCDHVATNYHRVRDCIQRAGITELYYMTPASAANRAPDARFAHVSWGAISMAELDQHPFWDRGVSTA